MGKEFKVGDRVRLPKVRPDYWNQEGRMDKYLGEEVTIETIYGDGHNFTFDDDGGWIYNFNGVELVLERSITFDSKIYTALKSLSPESVYRGNPCKNEFADYCSEFNFYDEPDFDEFIEEVCPNHPSWLPWLIKNGYVKVEDVKRKLKPTFEIRVGDKFAVDLGYGDKGYILAGLSCNRYALVDMQTGVTMNSIIEGDLNLETFKNLCGFFNWEKVYSTRIPYKA
jgi:hypothetical protein